MPPRAARPSNLAGGRLNAALDPIGKPMRNVIRTLRISGRRSSARLEAMFWQALDEICAREGFSLDELATKLADRESPCAFASMLRTFAVAYFHDADLVTTGAPCPGSESL